MNSWEEWKKNVGSWLGEAAQDTDRLARLGLRAYDRHGIQRDLQRRYASLGRLIHPYLSGEKDLAQAEADARIRAEMGRIARLKEELEQTVREIEELRRQKARRGQEASSPDGSPEADDLSGEREDEKGANPPGGAD